MSPLLSAPQCPTAIDSASVIGTRAWMAAMRQTVTLFFRGYNGAQY